MKKYETGELLLRGVRLKFETHCLFVQVCSEIEMGSRSTLGGLGCWVVLSWEVFIPAYSL